MRLGASPAVLLSRFAVMEDLFSTPFNLTILSCNPFYSALHKIRRP